MKKICKEPGCNKEVKCRGMCMAHYMIARSAGTIQIGEKQVHSMVCACGKPTQRTGTRCRKCNKDHSEEQNRLIGRTCKVESCPSHRIEGKGYCQKHYLQFKRHGKILKSTRYDANPVRFDGEVSYLTCLSDAQEVTAEIKFDTEDLGKIQEYKWCYDATLGYARTLDENRKQLGLHHLVMGVGSTKSTIVDHISGDKLDCCKANLRFTTVRQNAINSTQGMGRHTSVPGIKGVYISGNRYVANIRNFEGKKITKSFKTLQEAVEYRKYLADKYHGEHAYENRPDESSTGI